MQSAAPLAPTPQLPYYAVIFTSVRADGGDDEYARMAAEMLHLAADQPGYLGVESARDADGVGITVSYWASREAIRAWGEHARHRIAQAMGRAEWYAAFRLRVALVEEDRLFPPA